MRPLWIAVVVAEQPHGPGIGSLPLQLPIGKLCEGTGPDDCSQQTKTTLTTFSSLKKTRLSQEDPSHHSRQRPRTMLPGRGYYNAVVSHCLLFVFCIKLLALAYNDFGPVRTPV